MKVVITGASSGIGAAAARAFAERGDKVALVARRADRLTDVAAACGPAAKVFPADLSDLDRLDDLAATIEADFGPVDVLVNNAGVPKRRRVVAMSADDLDEVMRINYHSPVRLSLAFLPRMIERGSGHIVNVSSMGVHSAAFGVGAYSASKAALELFTESMYLELVKTGVQAHLFVPGTTLTEFSDDKPGNDPSMVRAAPGAATAEQVAAALVASIDQPHFRTFATPGEAATCAAKDADPNAFLAGARDRLAAFL